MGAEVRITRSQVLRVAAPLAVANAAEPLAGLADTAAVSATGGQSELAGIALGVAATNVLWFTVYFLRMSTTGLVARAIGEKDVLSAQRAMVRSGLLGAALGLVAMAGRTFFADFAFFVLDGEPAAEHLGEAYLEIRCLGLPFGFALLALTGWLIAHGRSRQVLFQQLVFSLTNVALDGWWVLGEGWGPAGAAWATTTAHAVTFAFGALQVRTVLRAEEGGLRPETLHLATLFDPRAWRGLLGVNLDFVLRTWAMLGAFTWFANVGAKAGSEVLAANHVLLQVIAFWAFVLDAIAHVTESWVGRAVGAGSREALRNTVRVTSEVAIASGLVFALLTMAGGHLVLSRLVADPIVLDQVLLALPWCAAVPFVGAAAFQLDGVFVGATAAREMRNSAIISAVVYVLLDLSLSGFGVQSLWPAFLAYYLLRGGTLLALYPRLEARVHEG